MAAQQQTTASALSLYSSVSSIRGSVLGLATRGSNPNDDQRSAGILHKPEKGGQVSQTLGRPEINDISGAYPG